MTRSDLPEPVDPSPLAIALAAEWLEADLRRMDLDLQAERAKAIQSAAQKLTVELMREALQREALGLASPND